MRGLNLALQERRARKCLQTSAVVTWKQEIITWQINNNKINICADTTRVTDILQSFNSCTEFFLQNRLDYIEVYVKMRVCFQAWLHCYWLRLQNHNFKFEENQDDNSQSTPQFQNKSANRCSNLSIKPRNWTQNYLSNLRPKANEEFVEVINQISNRVIFPWTSFAKRWSSLVAFQIVF